MPARICKECNNFVSYLNNNSEEYKQVTKKQQVAHMTSIDEWFGPDYFSVTKSCGRMNHKIMIIDDNIDIREYIKIVYSRTLVSIAGRYIH